MQLPLLSERESKEMARFGFVLRDQSSAISDLSRAGRAARGPGEIRPATSEWQALRGAKAHTSWLAQAMRAQQLLMQ